VHRDGGKQVGDLPDVRERDTVHVSVVAGQPPDRGVLVAVLVM